MVDVFWEGVPNWLVAVTGALTLAAALIAAIYAGRAAHWTKAQAESSEAQAAVAADTLRLALKESAAAQERLASQEADMRRAERRQSESRLDTIAPVVMATARRQALMIRLPGKREFDVASHDVEIRDDELAAFRTTADITLTNVSSRIARIDFTDLAQGELDVRQGIPIFLAPGQQKMVSWSRTIGSGSLRSESDLGRPENWWMTVELWVRDLGCNVRDTLCFGGDFRHFTRDGSRLLVAVEPVFDWTENVAEPTHPRVYERLEAGLDGISPAGKNLVSQPLDG